MKRARFLNCEIDFSRPVGRGSPNEAAKWNFRPRMETEFWVKKAIKNAEKRSRHIRVLDIFAGTGCIGIAVLKNIKNSRIDFVDISEDAIRQIKINLKLNKIEKSRYEIYKSNLFKKLAGHAYRQAGKRYDFIFANPPYVALDRISEVQKEVLKNEPLLALFSGKDGTIIIKKFFEQVKNHLKPAGKIFLEFDPLQKEKIKIILKKEGFRFIFRKDQFGKYRWLEAKKA